jgi:hypothetical protein
MGGLALDIVVEYLCRVIAQLVRLRRSSSWLRVPGTVNFSAPTAGTFGCTLAELSYVYKVDGEFYSGKFTRPFLRRLSAEEYISRFPSDSKVTARVKPDEHSISFLDEEESMRQEQVEAQSI